MRWGCSTAGSPADTVVVVGAGPIGLAAITAARRLEAASRFGADVTVRLGDGSPADVIAELSDGLGADVAIEAVGVPESFELCTSLVRPGGRVANIGVHGKPAT